MTRRSAASLFINTLVVSTGLLGSLPTAWAADISEATQISAIYNPAFQVQVVYFADKAGHLNQIITNSSSGELVTQYRDLTALFNLPIVTSPTVSAAYDGRTGANLIFYLSGMTTHNVVMVKETVAASGQPSVTASFPSADNFKVGGVAQPANTWGSVSAATLPTGDVVFAVQIENGQDDLDRYGYRGYVFINYPVDSAANSNINLYKFFPNASYDSLVNCAPSGQKYCPRDPEHLQQQVSLAYNPVSNTAAIGFDPEGEGHIHTVQIDSNAAEVDRDLMNATDAVGVNDTNGGGGSGGPAVCTPGSEVFVTTGTDAEIYFYGRDGYLHEIIEHPDHSLNSLDITKSAKAPLLGKGCGPIAAVYNSAQNATNVVYTSPSSSGITGYQLNVIGGAGIGKWNVLYTFTGTETPILGSPMSSALDDKGVSTVFYVGQDSTGAKQLYKLALGSTYQVSLVGN